MGSTYVVHQHGLWRLGIPLYTDHESLFIAQSPLSEIEDQLFERREAQRRSNVIRCVFALLGVREQRP